MKVLGRGWYEKYETKGVRIGLFWMSYCKKQKKNIIPLVYDKGKKKINMVENTSVFVSFCFSSTERKRNEDFKYILGIIKLLIL
jgi:hypothetical protein